MDSDIAILHVEQCTSKSWVNKDVGTFDMRLLRNESKPSWLFIHLCVGELAAQKETTVTKVILNRCSTSNKDTLSTFLKSVVRNLFFNNLCCFSWVRSKTHLALFSLSHTQHLVALWHHSSVENVRSGLKAFWETPQELLLSNTKGGISGLFFPPCIIRKINANQHNTKCKKDYQLSINGFGDYTGCWCNPFMLNLTMIMLVFFHLVMSDCGLYNGQVIWKSTAKR